MYQRKDGIWCDTLPRKGKAPKFFYGKTKADVKRKMSEWKDEQEKGILLDVAVNELIEAKSARLRYNSIRTLTTASKHVTEHFGATKPIKEIEPKDVQAFANSLVSCGVSRSLIEKCIAVLRECFDAEIIKGNMDDNPCDRVKIVGVTYNHRELPSPEHIEKIKCSVGLPFGLFPYLLIYTGLRRGEALALTRKDFDFKNNTITVNKAIVHEGYEPVVSQPKTKTSVRTVPLLKPLRDQLEARRWDGFLFSNDGGKSPLNLREFDNAWKAYCRDAGLTHFEQVKNGKYMARQKRCDVSPHQLRHEFATLCYDAGLAPLDAAGLLGHSNDRTTMEIYTHLRDSRKKESVQKLSDYVECSY